MFFCHSLCLTSICFCLPFVWAWFVCLCLPTGCLCQSQEDNSDKLFIKKASISGFKDSIDMLENTSKSKKSSMFDSESVDCLEKIGTSKTMSALEEARAYLQARKRLASLQSYQQERPRFELMRQVAHQGKIESEQSTRKTRTWVSPYVGYEERRGVGMKGSQAARESIIKGSQTARESESRRILRKSGFRGGSGVLTGSFITRSKLSQHSYLS